MGFYAPAQIVRDARDHGVEVRPWMSIIVNTIARWKTSPIPAYPLPTDPDKRAWGRGGPALRLGFRMVKGLHIAHARRIVECAGNMGRFHPSTISTHPPVCPSAP
jgi:error-prone DNA polymerase